MGAIDLVVCGAEWRRERKATREESQALGTVLKTVQTLAAIEMFARFLQSRALLAYVPISIWVTGVF